MKIVVIGGTGLIGTTVVAYAGARGHEAIAASPRTGVNTLTGEGLAAALAGAAVVADPEARYYGAELGAGSLVPEGEARLGAIRFEEWLGQPVQPG